MEGYVVSAVLALMGLLLGFTFALSVDRFETRRALVLQEANAIGTAYLRSQALTEPHRSRMSKALVDYTNNRIALEAVRYKSEPDAMTDLLSGRVPLMNSTATSVLAHVKAGKLRALSTAFDQRSPLMPDVPSIVEAGQARFPISPWFALVGPAGLPPEVVATMNKAMAAVLAKPAVREQMQRHGFLPKSSTPECFDC